MPQTTKTSTSVGKTTTNVTNPDLDNKLGIDEPVINPTLVGATFRYKGRIYRYNENEEIVRFYPPGVKKPRTSARMKP